LGLSSLGFPHHHHKHLRNRMVIALKPMVLTVRYMLMTVVPSIRNALNALLFGCQNNSRYDTTVQINRAHIWVAYKAQIIGLAYYQLADMIIWMYLVHRLLQ
jgi:hypothetical protein